MKSYNYSVFTIHEFAELESTNSHAKSLADAREISDHEIILARKQSGGRGREDRVWISPLGNLYFSMVLCPKISSQKVAQLSFVAIVALLAAVSKITDCKVEVKWPNDLLINEKKVAGLLLESKILQNDCQFAVIGIGVNTLFKPENVIFPAAALSDFGVEISPDDLLKKFLDEFEKFYQKWQDFGFEFIRKAWLEKTFRLQKEISVKLGNSEKLTGIFIDLDAEGNLLLECAEGVKKIAAADIFR